MKLALVLFGVVAALLNSGASAASSKQAYSVTLDATTNKFTVSHTYDTSADAYGYYSLNDQGAGWNYLDANAQQEVTSQAYHLQSMRALGFLEGYSTCETIKAFYPNFYSAVFGTDRVGSGTLNFLRENYQWMQKMAAEHAATDDYWYTISTILHQINGLFEGYVAGCSSEAAVRAADPSNLEIFRSLDNPTLEHFLLINAWGDLYQITLKYFEPGRNSRLHGSRKLKGPKKTLVQRCSAIIKLLPDLSDVTFGHATWDSFESLAPRIIKHISHPLVRRGFAEHHYDTYYSSSPAVLSSVDDFFTASGYAQLGVIETTNELYNVKLLDLVQPASVLSWARAVTANQMATSGADWAKQFSRYPSGTYTNQWMAIDLKLFTPGQAPPEGFLTVLEEVPGLIHVEDKTSHLVRESYWPSYNIPYYDDIYQASGNAAACEKNPNNCYDIAPRAKLFAQYQSTVVDAQSTELILSHNDWQHDAASANDSCNAIACRGDVEPNPLRAGAFGALDAKVSTATWAKREPGVPPQILARLGPTHDQQPVFCWSKFDDEASYSHSGQPDCFDFGVGTFPSTSEIPSRK